jgi:hypothetical protein
MTNDIIVVISGGTLQGVYSDKPVNVTVLDYDSAADYEKGEICEIEHRIEKMHENI